VLSGLVEALAAATGLKPAGTAESVARRFAAWLADISQPWLLVLDDLDDLADPADLEGPWPRQMPAGRILITARQAAAVAEIPRVRVVPPGPSACCKELAVIQPRNPAAPSPGLR
jgi:hypothetical protein